MLVIKLKGGLGNQLFQYAFGRALSISTQKPLLLDIGYFRSAQTGETPRNYCLHHYPLDARIGMPWLLKTAFRSAKKLSKLPGIESRVTVRSVREASFRYQEPELPRGYGIWYYDGYWQAPSYFEDIRPTLLRELQPSAPARGSNARMLERIDQCDAISVHVRRGDYVSNTVANAFHGLCDPHYYHTAMRRMAESVANPVFYIFSDDIPWARANIKTDYPMVFVEHNDDAAAFEDIRLMSACRHHIIANSSFSWWGAWLNGRADKKVIAPRRWFCDSTMSCADLIPTAWSRL